MHAKAAAPSARASQRRLPGNAESHQAKPWWGGGGGYKCTYIHVQVHTYYMSNETLINAHFPLQMHALHRKSVKRPTSINTYLCYAAAELHNNKGCMRHGGHVRNVLRERRRATDSTTAGIHHGDSRRPRPPPPVMYADHMQA